MEWSLRLKQLIGVSSLINLITASIITDVNPVRAYIGQFTKRDASPWPYGVIGDSWGSGVSYNKDVLYDDNRDNCLRTKESHGPQLEADTSWTGSFSSGLRDAACSGSRLVDLAKGGYQMGKVGTPNVVVMTSGGNNCGFGAIVDVCIYHSSPSKDYGPAYADDKDRTGDCAKALDDALNYITNTLRQDLINTINDILADPNVKSNPDFLLYLTGYAQFFGTDYDPWCNTEAWNIAGRSATPYLSKELRTAFNDRVSKVNELYKKTIEENYSKQVRYIDVDAGFQGHRFCEPGMNHGDQLNTDTNFDKVYLWNLNWPWQVANQSAPDPDEQNGVVSAEEAEQLFGGNGVTAWGGSGGSGGEGNDPGNGWRLRPFHPRYTGYTSIKDAILAQLKADGLPKASSAPTVSEAPSASPSPTVVAPADPPAAPSCVPNPTDKVKDAHENELKKAAKFFCDKYASGTMTTPNVNIAQTIISGVVPAGRSSIDIARLYTGSDNKDDVYDISVKSVDGCTPEGGFNLDTPVSGNSCSDILHSAWKQCMQPFVLPPPPLSSLFPYSF